MSIRYFQLLWQPQICSLCELCLCRERYTSITNARLWV